ncbi:uncharacterized protein LOC124405906 [Diprion similis]|uniref:uncharacterized protein LOC124405906 n=1 Tax=Diprion similis TaxID=362088 RepID=UPI001EF93B74|nr:uncharacterized protein LOC124405906 [Diprion similis]
MFKFVVLAALVAVASAAPGGLLAAPYAIPHSVPVATSYANTYKVSVKSPIIAAAPAPIAYSHPIVAAAPAAYPTPPPPTSNPPPWPTPGTEQPTSIEDLDENPAGFGTYFEGLSLSRDKSHVWVWLSSVEDAESSNICSKAVKNIPRLIAEPTSQMLEMEVGDPFNKTDQKLKNTFFEDLDLLPDLRSHFKDSLVCRFTATIPRAPSRNSLFTNTCAQAYRRVNLEGEIISEVQFNGGVKLQAYKVNFKFSTGALTRGIPSDAIICRNSISCIIAAETGQNYSIPKDIEYFELKKIHDTIICALYHLGRKRTQPELANSSSKVSVPDDDALLYKRRESSTEQISLRLNLNQTPKQIQINMFKLVVLSAFVAVAFARPSAHHALVVSPAVVGSLVSEKTVESHGNTVVHSSAPVVHAAVPAVAYAAAAPLVAAVPAVPAVHAVHAVHAVPQAHLVSEKTIESHGNSVVHGTAPVLSYAAAVPAVRYAAAVPVAPHSALISEKSVSSYGHSVVHHAAPVVHTLAAAPALAYSAYAHPAVSVW